MSSTGNHTARLAEIREAAEQAFGDPEKAKRWLRKANRLLDGKKPIELVATASGTALVYRVLGAIEYGGLA